MIDDIKTVLWKEVKEEILANKQVQLGLLVTVPVFGVALPWDAGRSFMEMPYLLIFLAAIPLVMVINILTDSFAGERERHTLETLLSTRLSDHAILFGKILAAVAYAWGTTLLTIAISLITINLVFGQGRLWLFSPLEGLLIILITFLVSILITSAGVMVSLRASTVRQAETGFLIGMTAIFFLPMAIAILLPGDLKESLLNWLINTGLDNIMVYLAFMLIVLIAAVLSIAMNRFQRSKLILD
ncbi:MAG TPA: ABC transporter permease [Methanocella sp.]|nr:ABC transporter permease [Methanocella sp.]